MIKDNLELLGYACDIAANMAGSAKGPAILQSSEYLKPLGLKWAKTLETKSKKHQLDALDDIHTLCKKLALQTMHKAREQHPFLTIGGDHSAAIGTWNGAAAGLKDPLGLIWIDAHMDSHTPKTSVSKNIHGMPLAALLGYGDEKLTHIGNEEPAIQPDNLALIGIRSFEDSEANLLKMLKVKVYYMEEIQKRGLHQVMQEAIAHVTHHAKHFGVSIDVDAINPEEAPAVSTPEKNGLIAADLIESLSLVAKNSHFIGAEIAEFNPEHDQQQKTEKLIKQLIETLFYHS
ncbi:MAG: arginase [Coxiellaceae bacterium]|nr:arginase [Coxiellaceae bacterium]